MNYRMVTKIMGYILGLEMLILIVPLILAIAASDGQTARAFVWSMAVIAAFCLPTLLIKPRSTQIFVKDAFVIVAGSWIVISLFGALPYYFSGLMGGFADCLFESVSGFTTTGATILGDIEALPLALLFWRNLTHWMAGMGVLLFVLAVFSFSGGQSYSIMRVEATGPSTGKMAPKVSQTARILYGIYFGITFVQVIVYMLCGMPFFDALMHAFSTAATGGFSIKNASVAAYDSTLIEGATTFFMILCGINFNLLYLLLLRKFAQVFKNEEIKTFLLLIVAATALVAFDLCRAFDVSVAQAFNMAVFQVATMITTTGFYTEPFEYWPQLSKAVLFTLMLIGGCAGSTSGGMKVVRSVLGFKVIRYNMNKMLHPRSVEILEYHGKPVESATLKSLGVFIGVYMSVLFVSFLGLSLCNVDFETTLSATVSAISNVGPGLGQVGATMNYAFWPTPAKYLLIADMLLGRLEFFPILLLFVPEVWRKKRLNQPKSYSYIDGDE